MSLIPSREAGPPPSPAHRLARDVLRGQNNRLCHIQLITWIPLSRDNPVLQHKNFCRSTESSPSLPTVDSRYHDERCSTPVRTDNGVNVNGPSNPSCQNYHFSDYLLQS